MRLKSLELTNYRKFKQAFIEFPDGVVGIMGPNGVGKSTIIEAIAWVMYGNETRIVRTSKDDLKRSDAAPGDTCAVKLAFELDGDKYQVSRVMKGKNFTTSAEVLVNNKSAATSTKSVTAFIEQLLGMDYQAFYTSVFTKQRELNAMSALDPSKRKRLILRMLNIDSIDKAIASMRGRARELKSRLAEVRAMLTEPDGTLKIDSAHKQIKEYEANIKTISNEILEMEKQKAAIEKQVHELGRVRDEQRKLHEDNIKLDTKLTECKTKLDGTDQQQRRVVKTLEELGKLQQKLAKLEFDKTEWETLKKSKTALEEAQAHFIRADELREQLQTLDKEILKYKKELHKGEKDLKRFETLDKDLGESRETMELVGKELVEKNKSLSELKSQQNMVTSEIKKFKDRLKSIKDLGPDSECPMCERQLNEQYKFLEDKFQTEMSEASSQLEKLIKTEGEAKAAVADTQKRLEALKKRELYLNQRVADRARAGEVVSSAKSVLSDLHGKRQKLEGGLVKYKALKFDPEEFKVLKSRYLSLEKDHERFISLTEQVEAIPKTEKELGEIQKEAKALQQQVAILEEQSAVLGFDKDVLKQTEANYDKVVKKLKAAELQLMEKKNELRLHQKDVQARSKDIERYQAQTEKVNVYEDELIYLNKLDELFNKFRNYMISRIAPALTQFASELFRELTDGRYNRLEVNENYDVLIYDNGQEYHLERFSGGEEDLANLCLRLAISQVITTQTGTAGTNFVILDEIFGSQDANRKRNLMQTLNGLSNKFRQIVLITHIEDVKDYIEYNIEVIENEDGTSGIRVMG